MNELQRENEEREWYGRRICVRVDSMAFVENETYGKVVDYFMAVKQEVKFDIPEVVFHSAHTIGKDNIDKNSKNYFKIS